jgi:glutathione S-transferase
MFEQPELMLRFNNQGVPGWEDRFIRYGLPFAKRFIARALEITPGIEREDESTVWAEFDWVAEVLADGRPYLLGERFTAADLTFAALAAPIVLPAVYGVALPPIESLDAPTAALIARGREHPAGAYALRLTGERKSLPTLPVS